MIDLHSHILPGIDDGAPDLSDSLEMARAAVEGGVEEIVATPHVDVTFHNDPRGFAEQVQQLQRELDAAGVPLTVHRGGEVAISRYPELSDDQLDACTLGGGNYILLEPPLAGPTPFVDRIVSDLQTKGYRVLLAHPERIAAFQSDMARVQALVDQGCVTSVTAASVSGQFGGSVKKFTARLFERGLVHNLASDAHDPRRRSPNLRGWLDEAVAALPELEPHIRYLTEAVPRAVLAGEAAPTEPPAVASRRGLFGRLRTR